MILQIAQLEEINSVNIMLINRNEQNVYNNNVTLFSLDFL